MKVTKGTLLEVVHNRKGKFKAIATENFDTDNIVFYPVRMAYIGEGGDTEAFIKGKTRSWVAGDEVSCRNTLCKITILQEAEK